MSSGPLVTIAAINYNNARFVIDTLNSIKNQSYSNIELIIVDDCSTDESPTLIQEWLNINSFHAKFIIHNKNLGVCVACNSALNQAKGKYFSLIATDDILLPNKTQFEVEAIEICSVETGAIYSDMVMINEHGLPIYESYFNVIGIEDNFFSELFNRTIEDQIAFLINKNIFPAPTLLYKKEVLLGLGGFDENLYFEDWDINLRLIHAGYKFCWLNEKLVKYRFLQSSLTRKPNPRYWDTYLALISKYSGLSNKLDSVIYDKIREYAVLIYQLGGENSIYWLKKKYAMDKDAKTLIYIMLAALGISYSPIKYFRNKFFTNENY